mmetsp:Transcript_15882/g.64037  ORF Transcript_15882/g.64037 Transcript_15882/m.64037 type:complete len:324 (+) Transcript_15882:268-1239(+)
MGASYAANFQVVIARICIGVLLKFMLGGDDLVWLAPFMARAKKVHQKVNVGVKYVLSVLFLTALACALAFGIHTAAMSQSDDDLVDQIIATVAAVLLVAYSVHMAVEEGYVDAAREHWNAWLKAHGFSSRSPSDAALAKPPSESADLIAAAAQGVTEYGAVETQPVVDDENSSRGEGGGAGNDDDDDEELGPIKACVRDSLLACDTAAERACFCCRWGDDDDDDTKKTEEEERAHRSVVIVAFLGSMDDFMVYFTLALSKQLSWYELTMGVTIGAILIALIVGSLLQSSESLAACVESIPVPLVLIGLAAFIVISAWTEFDGA